MKFYRYRILVGSFRVFGVCFILIFYISKTIFSLGDGMGWKVEDGGYASPGMLKLPSCFKDFCLHLCKDTLHLVDVTLPRCQLALQVGPR